MQKSGAQTARILPSSAREIGAKKDFGRKTKKTHKITTERDGKIREK